MGRCCRPSPPLAEGQRPLKPLSCSIACSSSQNSAVRPTGWVFKRWRMRLGRVLVSKDHATWFPGCPAPAAVGRVRIASTVRRSLLRCSRRTSSTKEASPNAWPSSAVVAEGLANYLESTLLCLRFPQLLQRGKGSQLGSLRAPDLRFCGLPFAGPASKARCM